MQETKRQKLEQLICVWGKEKLAILENIVLLDAFPQIGYRSGTAACIELKEDPSFYLYERRGTSFLEKKDAMIQEEVPEKEKQPESAAGVMESEQINQEEKVIAAAVPTKTLYERVSERIGCTKEQLLDSSYLLPNIYVVSGQTSPAPELLEPGKLIEKDLSIKKEGEYQILIYHTHSQEAYIDSEAGNRSHTVVGMGELLKTELEKYGYSVLHSTGIYDMTDGTLDRNPAYTKALPVVSSILEAYPEIQVVIDLHRDGVKEDVHLVTEIDGKMTARVMYYNGLCRTPQGEREDVRNPYREGNLAFSLQMALTTIAEYNGLLRCIYLNSNRYNQHLRERSLLIELGAQTNTVEEARNAVPILANMLNEILSDTKI